MKQALVRRLERVEQRLAIGKDRDGKRASWMNTLELAMYAGLALRLAGRAKEALEAAGTSLDPERRVELTKVLEGARKIGKALKDPSLSAGLLIPERSGDPLGALHGGGPSRPPVPVGPPADPPLLPHAYIYIIEGERERSGERAWLAMEGPKMILRTFHGVHAQQLARDWIGTKFGALPAEEIEVLLPADDKLDPLYEGDHDGFAG